MVRLILCYQQSDLSKCHNKAMAQMNLMKLHQKSIQDIQEFGDQYNAKKAVCTVLGQSFGRCKEHARAVLKDEGVIELSQQQINKSLNKLEE